MTAKKGTRKSAKSTSAISKTSKGLTDDERVAMRGRMQELKAEGRRGPRADKAEGESELLAKIAKEKVITEALAADLRNAAEEFQPAFTVDKAPLKSAG